MAFKKKNDKVNNLNKEGRQLPLSKDTIGQFGQNNENFCRE